MTPKVFGLFGDAPDPAAIAEAAGLIRKGGIVAFPTETVYGLGVDATNAAAVDRLNKLKGRPPEKPYSWHLPSADAVRAQLGEVPPVAGQLMDKFWPGPLTIILPARNGTIGFRVPDHPIAQAFLTACGVPVAAPSANRSGQPPPTDAAEVLAALGDSIDCVLDAGPTKLGKESTVIEVVRNTIEIRRHGAVPEAAIREAIGNSR
jgi:L-threonylcarbamoyladenylate synthase